MPYKATYNYKCLNQTYEIGQEYKIEGKPIICNKGFHFCKKASKVLDYYEYVSAFKLLEIEDLSNDTVHEDEKSCSNHIKIIREITDPDELISLLSMYKTFDEKGNPLMYKNSSGYWDEYTYDENGREIMYKDRDGFWTKRTYNKQGKCTKYEESNGYFRETTFDENGKEILFKNSLGYERITQYDEKGREISFKDSNGRFELKQYDENGTVISRISNESE